MGQFDSFGADFFEMNNSRFIYEKDSKRVGKWTGE